MDFGLALKAIVMGIVQGLTEFLPISSSAHLILTDRWFSYWMPNTPALGKSFDIALHAGTLVALLLYFRKDIAPLCRAAVGLVVERGLGDPQTSPRNYHYRRMVCLLAAASVPAGLLGLLFDDWIEKNLEGYASIAFGLVVFGLVLGAVDRFGRHSREIGQLSAWEVICIGFGQAMALMPGVSRSGSTMTVGLALGLTRSEAANFSFLLALPITAAAVLLKAVKGLKVAAAAHTLSLSAAMPVTVGIFASFVSGLFCMHFLMRFLRTQSFAPFVVYRVLLGGVLIYLWLST